jgi:hypothetical protein
MTKSNTFVYQNESYYLDQTWKMIQGSHNSNVATGNVVDQNSKNSVLS